MDQQRTNQLIPTVECLAETLQAYEHAQERAIAAFFVYGSERGIQARTIIEYLYCNTPPNTEHFGLLERLQSLDWSELEPRLLPS